MVQHDRHNCCCVEGGCQLNGAGAQGTPTDVITANRWEPTNHAVVAVGYGTDAASGLKYWVTIFSIIIVLIPSALSA